MVTYAVDPAHFSFFLLFGFSFSAPDSDIPVTKYVFRFGIVSFLDSDKFPRGNKSFIDSKLAGEIARNTRRGVVKLQSFHDPYFIATVASFAGLLTVHSRLEFPVTLMSRAPPSFH
jgi:hypothetical protein